MPRQERLTQLLLRSALAAALAAAAAAHEKEVRSLEVKAAQQHAGFEGAMRAEQAASAKAIGQAKARHAARYI